MKQELFKELSDEKLRRHTGIKRKTFVEMMKVLEAEDKKKKAKGGRKNKLSLEKQLLMTLEYLREYRTYFHIGNQYGISEGSAYKGIKWVEDTLIKSKLFSLPGKKSLEKSDFDFEVVIVDATETPIERPKKSKKTSTLERKKDTL